MQESILEVSGVTRKDVERERRRKKENVLLSSYRFV